jgi:hypothetical protein
MAHDMTQFVSEIIQDLAIFILAIGLIITSRRR